MIEWKPQVLCVLGRGIERMDGTNTWRPTAYVERLSEENGHSGLRIENITAFDEDPKVVISGGEVNAVAGALFYKELALAGAPPAVVTFAGGRPAYLAKEPQHITEGRILYERFQEVSLHTRSEIVFQDGNSNTRDDLQETLKLAQERSFRRIAIVTVTVHIPRCLAFVSSNWLQGMEIRFFASEPIVHRFLPGEYEYLYEAMISPAYTRTAERERKGISDLRAGRYNFGSQNLSLIDRHMSP